MAEDVEVATAFYHAVGHAPNGRTADDASKFEMYYRCMAVFFASARRALPTARLVLYTNLRPPKRVGEWFKRSGASVELVPGNAYVTDPAFTNAFPGCLFTLDLIDHLASKAVEPARQLVLLDSDCVVLRPPTRILRAIDGPMRASALQLNYDVHASQNGQSRASLTLIANVHYAGRSAMPLRYFGGELYAMRTDAIVHLAANVRRIWSLLKRADMAWLGPQLTEEHVMSLALNDPDLAVHDASDSIKRIWTADNFSNLDGREPMLDIWHLPAEKRRGFQKMFADSERLNASWTCDDNEFVTMATARMNLNPTTPVRTLRRARGLAKSLARTLVGR